MQVYYYNSAGIYTHSSQLDDTDRDPLNPDDFLVPAGCTVIAPPELIKNQVALWNGSDWRIEADYRGTKYWLHGTEHVMTELGEFPSGASRDKPPVVIDKEFSTAKAAALRKIEASADQYQTRLIGANSPQREARFAQNLAAAKRVIAGVGTSEDMQSMTLQAAAKAAEIGEPPKALEFAQWIVAWEGKAVLIAGAIEAFLVQSRTGLNDLSDISQIETFLADIAAQAEAKFSELTVG